MATINTARFILDITLESDLCVARGDGFSSGVDVDVCSDGRGFPFIPARRLKGCLREAALDCLSDRRDGAPGFRRQYEPLHDAFAGLFGTSGGSEGGSLRIRNAVLRDPGYACPDVQENLNRFTGTRAQTAIGPDGHADDNTLRFIRVVKQYNPNTGKKMSFAAPVSCNAEHVEVLKIACKALRNIGYGRNRGFGAVSCELIPAGDNAQGISVEIPGDFSPTAEGDWRLCYDVRLDSPVMAPQLRGGESADYIPGASVLGFFAGKTQGHPLFEKIVLSGKVRFSPLYPTDTRGNRCLPAPPFIVKLKGGPDDGALRVAWNACGQTAKPLKGGFVGGDFSPVDVASEIVYHHSRQGEDLLYTQQCIKAGQVFSGFIDGSADLLAVVIDVLEGLPEGGLSFGRSKTAQYASCTLTAARVQAVQPRTVEVKAGSRYAFVLDSDAIVVNPGSGRVEATQGELEEAISGMLPEDAKKAFAGCDASSLREGNEPMGSLLRSRTITGYNAKWNQKKPHVRAVAAGSCLSFTAESDCAIPSEFYVGERGQEGLGRIVLVDIAQVAACMEKTASHTIEDARPGDSAMNRESAPDALSEDERVLVIEYAIDNAWRFSAGKLNASFIGRLSRMAKEAADGAGFASRIASIKARRKREDAEELRCGMSAVLGNPEWSRMQEAMVLLLTVAKYLAKQEEPSDMQQKGDGDE